MTFHTYSIFDFVYYLAATYSYEIPIVFEEVDVKLIYSLGDELFGLKKYNFLPGKSSFPQYYEANVSNNPKLSQEKINNLKNLLFEFEITKNPKISFLKLHKEPNALSQLTREYFKSDQKFISCLESNDFNLAHIIFNLCYCLELVKYVGRCSPDEYDLYESIESISEKRSKYTISVAFSLFCDHIIYDLMNLISKEPDYLSPLFGVWIYIYRQHKEYFDAVDESMVTLIKILARVNHYTIKGYAEEIRESEKAKIFGFDYLNLLPENIKFMKQLAYEYNQLNEQVKLKVFNKLSRLHSSELWANSIEFLKTYYNDKRMTIGNLRTFLEKSKNEISQPKNINLLDYLKMNEYRSDPTYKKYINIQRNKIEYSYVYYLLYEASNFNLEAIYLVSKKISIDEKYFMKRILSRKFYILDVFVFQMSTQYLSVPENFLADVRIQLPGLLYPLGKNEFKFCQEVVSKYPLDFHIVYPFFDVKYDMGSFKLFSRSRYLLQGSNYEDIFDYSNYLFFFYYEANEVDSMFQGFAQSGFIPNQYFRKIFDISEENPKGVLLKHMISLYVSTYECLKSPDYIKEETRNFILNYLNVPFKRDLLIDVLTGNESAPTNPDYAICKQIIILNVQENQKETFSKFYKIMEMFDQMIDPYQQNNFELLKSFDFSKYGSAANKYKSFQSQVISKVISQPGYLASKVRDKIEKKIPTDLPKLQAFCNSFESQEEELYIDDIKYIKTEGKYQMKTLMNLEISQNVTDVSDKFISDLNEEKLTVGSLILRLLQNSNAFECNMKIFSNSFKERNEEQKLKIEKQSNLSEFYFNLQKEIESKEKIHKTKISFINDFNDDLPEKMTKERFNLFEKLLFVDKNKWKLIENSFLSVFTFCEENHLFRYQEHIIAYTLKCIEENNNIFFTNPLKELYKFILNSIINEKENEFSEISPLKKENSRILARIKSNMKVDVLNALKAEFTSTRKKQIKEKLEVFSDCFYKIVKNIPLLMVKPKFESVDYSFDKVKFYNMILSYNQLNLDLSEYKEFVEYDFVFQDKGPLYVKNIKTDKSYCYSQSQSPHLLTLGNSSKSNYKFENSNPAWTTVRIPKIRQNFEDYNFEFFCNLYQELEDLVRKENIESQTIFGLNFNDFTEFLGTISKIKKENFSFNFQNHMNSIKLDSSYPNTVRVITKYIEMTKEIKEIKANENLTNLLNEKLSKIKEIEIPRINNQNKTNCRLRLQTKFTPKIVITDDGIKPNFSQIYFYNFNVNFEYLEIIILIEGSFQFLDVSVKSFAIIKSEVIEDKIILTVNFSTSKPQLIKGILKIADVNIPIMLCFGYDSYRLNGPNFVFNDMKSDLDFRNASLESINTDEMIKIVYLIDSYKSMSDKFSELFFGYLKSYQKSFPINLSRIFSSMYSLHQFFETHSFDEFCPYYFSAKEFEASFSKLLRILGIDISSEEENFDFYNIFCYKKLYDNSIVDDPNIKRKTTNDKGFESTNKEEEIVSISLNDEQESQMEQSSEVVAFQTKTEPDENINSGETSLKDKASNIEAPASKIDFQSANSIQENNSQQQTSNQSSTQQYQSNNPSERSIDNNNTNRIEPEEERRNIKQLQTENVSYQGTPQLNQMQQEFNNMQNYFMQQNQMLPQYQRMIPPQIQNNPQAILQYQQIQNQYQSLQMQLSSVQQFAFQFSQMYGVNPINDILMPNGGFFYPPNIVNHKQEYPSQQQQPKI
ncbi:hypothetical protein TVAG_139110 [Trichomonas vaginalis G3]|uniref:Uncharacterized protein n=1 Tax=Trichomonas vaginalis (strain ATCC PRA-98 / G3) TaxID=412133 RepID=A2E485_TRIV3|nr:zebrafish dkey-56m19.5 family [Trichomonas vaginalis G3]EAY12531.1 hypothetical protein TVAG_139110 [Trichomonas vaginalis G3]KAI5554069.1 zebrafish dkey-56m19.5 family [Trichomonas vaginalis G3]|eukprot:XP_001324754.1 hypothetical protein [Trichomonas vaginalis G3]